MNRLPANDEYSAISDETDGLDNDPAAATIADVGVIADTPPDASGWLQPRTSDDEAEPSRARVARVSFTPFAEPSDAMAPRGLDFLLDVELHVTVELGRTSMTIKEVLSVGPGSIVELDTLAGDNVDILVNGTLIAKGEVVVVDDKFGVRVTEVVSPAKRIQTLARRDGA